MNLSDKIKANTELLFTSVNALNAEQLSYKPAENSWSVLECLEHIYLIDKAVLGAISAPPSENSSENNKTELFSEEKLNKLLIGGRSFKVPAPDFVKPTGQFSSIDEATQSIQLIINKIDHFITSHPFEQYTHTYKHPVLGAMTPTDWIHFLVSHTQRHIHQIEDLKAGKNFPS